MTDYTFSGTAHTLGGPIVTLTSGDSLLDLAGSQMFGDGDANPIWACGDDISIVVKGAISSVDYACIYGCSSGGTVSIVIGPTGSLDFQGANIGQAAAIFLNPGWDGSTITNKGVITSDWAGIKVDASFTRVDNQGQITADHDGLYLSGHDMTVLNSGDIDAHGAAVIVRGGTFDNSGDIAGDIGVNLGFDTTFYGVKVDNSGTITGLSFAVLGHDGDDRLTNTSAITGVVALGAGADKLDTRTGTISGAIDLGSGNDTALGSDGADSILGSDGADSINGEKGDDSLLGGAGVDSLTGGKGADALTGGLDADLFIYKAAFGLDVITDFKDSGADRIEFMTGTFDNFSQVSAAMHQVGSDVVITLDASNVITLQDTVLANVTSSDFIFG